MTIASLERSEVRFGSKTIEYSISTTAGLFSWREAPEPRGRRRSSMAFVSHFVA